MPGTLLIVAAPSGAGKTTLVRELLQRDSRVQLSISYTTRQPRTGEVDGRDYNFVTVDAFLAMRGRGDFLESAEVHGNFYGTSRPWLEQQLAAGHDVLLEIDWQGAQQVRLHVPDAVGVFILPPSREALEERMRKRGQDSEDTIARRLANAREEMSHHDEFEYVIVNETFETAVDEMCAIFTASRLRREAQAVRHRALIETLLA